jgi:hypothetical protein
VVAGSSFPGVAEWADTYVRTTLSDTAALEAFGPRDGRPAGWDGERAG